MLMDVIQDYINIKLHNHFDGLEGLRSSSFIFYRYLGLVGPWT